MSDKSLFPAAAKLVPECTDGSGSGDWYRATSFKMDVVPVSPRHAAEEDSQLSGKKRRRTGKSHKKNRRIHQVAMTAEADSSSDFSDVDTASMLAVVDGAVSVEGRAWRLDRRGDAELGHFGNVYRLDVPVYHTLDDGLEGRVSSDELARRTHAMPSGLVQPSVEKKMRREDLRKMDRRRRFFGSGAMADWRSLALPVCRRVRSDGRAAAAGPLPYFIAAPAASIDTSSGDIGPHPVSTDAEYFRGILSVLQKRLNLFRNNANLSQTDQMLGWSRLCSAQACMTELQQLVSGVATQAYRKGFVSTVTSCSLVDRAPLFRDAQLPVENVKINTEKQIAVMQEAIRQLQVSNSDDSMAIMLHTRLHSLMGQLALLQGGGGPSRADSTKEIYAQLKERFPVSNLAVEITHSENRAQFSTCTVPSMRAAYVAERQRLGTEYRNARSSRRLLSDVTQVSAGIGVERLEEDKMLAAAIDNFFSMLICEKDAGFTERVVANVQCVIDLNFYLAPYAKKTCGISDDVKIIDDLCMHWDSESPRLGELCEGPPVFTPVVSIPESDESGLIPDCSDLSRWCFRGNDGHQPVSPHLYLSAGSKDWICRGRPTSGWVSGCGKLFWEFVPEPLLNATVNTDDQKDGSYEKIVNNNTTDSNEKVSFAETFLHEWFLNEEQAHRGQQAVRNNDDQLNKDGDEADAETQWVYSRLHGYRIPQPTVRDTSSAYRKILRDIRGDNAANGAASLAEVTDGRQIATELVTAADLSADPLVIHTRLEELASVEQFLPLRIQAEGQDKLIELQPERVIFADDIRANVLVVSSKSLLARLLIRCLEALGITFINCWAVPLSGLPSHAAQQGALQAPDSVLSISNGICSLPNIEVSEANKMDNIMSRLFGYLEGSLFEVCTEDAGNLIANFTCAVCPVNVHVDVIRQYVASRRRSRDSSHNFDSILEFTLRLLCRLVVSSNESSFDGLCDVDALLPFHCVSDIFCVILRLLTVRYLIDLILIQELAAITSGPKLRELKCKLINRFRNDCKMVLERSSSRGLSVQVPDSGRVVPRYSDLDCTVFNVYIELECSIERCHTFLDHYGDKNVHDAFGDNFSYTNKMNSKIVLSMLCNFSEKFNLLEREQDTMKQLEQGLLLTKGASDWLYSLLVEVPGASSLLYHSFQCRMQSNAAESDGVQPIVSAVVPGISWANSAAEVLSSLQQLYGIIVDREFKTTKDILKQWKKSTKAGVLVNTPNYEQAINDLSRVTEMRFAELRKEFPVDRDRPTTLPQGIDLCAASIKAFQSLLGSETVQRLDRTPPDYHVGLLLVWITYVSSISIEAASMSAASSFLPHSIDRALAIFDRLICDTLFTVQSIGAHASQDVTGDSQRPRRLVRIRMMLADWLVCLSQFIRAKLEFLHHVDYYYPIMLFEIRKYYAIEIMKPMLTAYKPFQSKMGQIAKDSLRIGLFLFPNDIHLQLYLKKSIPSLQRPISVIYFFWAIHLCDEIMSTYLFSTGGTLQTFHSLWETKLCLRVGEAVQMEKLSRGPFPVFYASVLERVNHSFENYVAVSSVGSKLMPRVWSLYIEALCEKGCDNEDLRRSFYRAIHQCPWSKRIWMLASGPDLRQAFTDKELNELKKVMEEKGIMQRIFLQ